MKVIGIGQPSAGDDGAGPAVIAALDGTVSAELIAIRDPATLVDLLDGPAILVSSIALGVCVDDTIHFFTKFARAQARGEDARRSLIYALTESGAAITITTVVLIIGFGTLLLSDFAPNFQMGFLAAVMIALAWVADFVVTAAVLSLFPSRAPVAVPATEAVAPVSS